MALSGSINAFGMGTFHTGLPKPGTHAHYYIDDVTYGLGDSDSDGDGIIDPDDNCPDDPNPNQEDADKDGVGDVCDNCPDDYNPDQADSNQDGLGDACECPCLGDMDTNDQVDLQDLDAMVNLLVAAGPPFIVTVGPGHCGDLDANDQVDLQDLDAMVNMLVAAGPPFIVECE
jgi:hypothetical protein